MDPIASTTTRSRRHRLRDQATAAAAALLLVLSVTLRPTTDAFSPHLSARLLRKPARSSCSSRCVRPLCVAYSIGGCWVLHLTHRHPTRSKRVAVESNTATETPPIRCTAKP